MAPPTFADLGKEARDLFSKGFHNGLVKLDVKTVAKNKVEFKISGSSNMQSKATEGKLETKAKCPAHGIALTETWDTKNKLNLKAELEDKLFKGMKLTLDSNLYAASGAMDSTLKTNYKSDRSNINIDSGLSLGPPVINASGVFLYKGWLAGANVNLDTGKQTVTKSQLAIGYISSDLKINTYVKDLTEFGGQIYQKVNDKTELGVNVAWAGSSAATKFGLAAKRKILDGSSFVSMSVDNKSLVNLGITNTIQPGVKLTTSFLLDAKAVSGGDHKVGLGLDLEL